MIFSARVEIRGLPGIADPAGLTIERALPVLGFSHVEQVHVGKIIRFQIEAEDEEHANAQVTEMCDRLLANPVIERSEVMLTPYTPGTNA